MTGDVLLDTHVLIWALADPGKLSDDARVAIENAAVRYVAAISWYELAWLIDNGRVSVTNKASLIRDASDLVTTVPLDWNIAWQASQLGQVVEFPKDPADRMIYASAIAKGVRLVTADRAIRAVFPTACLW